MTKVTKLIYEYVNMRINRYFGIYYILKTFQLLLYFILRRATEHFHIISQENMHFHLISQEVCKI